MKKKGLVTLVFACMVVLTIGLTACGEKSDDVLVTAINVVDSVELKVGERKTLSATVIPYNAVDKTLIFSSSNIGVARVNQNGDVIGVSAGSCEVVIKATNDVKKSVTVKVYGNVEGVTVANVTTSNVLIKRDDVANSYVLFTSTSIKSPITTKITASVTPANALQSVVYETSDSKVATVDSEGVVTFKKIEDATSDVLKKVDITVKSADNSAKFSTVRFEVQFYKQEPWETDDFALKVPTTDKDKVKVDITTRTIKTRERNVTLKTQGSVLLSSNDGVINFEPDFKVNFIYNRTGRKVDITSNVEYKEINNSVMYIKLPTIEEAIFEESVSVVIEESKTGFEKTQTFTLKYPM